MSVAKWIPGHLSPKVSWSLPAPPGWTLSRPPSFLAAPDRCHYLILVDCSPTWMISTGTMRTPNFDLISSGLVFISSSVAYDLGPSQFGYVCMALFSNP